MATEQVIRVTAKGEFGQLRSGLKNLQGDLRNVTDEIARSARGGGVFDPNQLRALDLFKRRFMETMGAVNNEIQEQIALIDRLQAKMQEAQRREQEEIRKTIQEREKELGVMRQQLQEQQRLQQQQNQGGGSPGGDPRSGGGGAGGGSGSPFMQGALSKFMGAGRFALGLAGVGGLISILTEAYEQAYAREVNSLDLAQRIRGSAGRFGSATELYDQASAVGRRDRMGYTASETWQFLDTYTRMAGNITTNQQYDLMKFGRAYGLQSGEVASLVGANVHAGGGDPSELADAIAGSVETSGMTARIAEVMETNNTLLQQMNTTLKDGSAKQILAYQTSLDRIGMAQGMKQLTGANGANIIGGLGGIYGTDPNNQWKWMGIQALQRYDPEKYGNMDLFDLEMAFEDGLLNPDNIPAMTKYIKGATGGNEKLAKRILQKWLTDGGFVASKRESSELWDATNGLENFSEEQMEALRNGSIDSGAKYDAERKGERGQGFLDTEARYQKALEGIGSQFVGAVMGLKEGITTVLEAFSGGLDEAIKKLGGWLEENGMLLLGSAAGMAALLGGMEDDIDIDLDLWRKKGNKKPDVDVDMNKNTPNKSKGWLGKVKDFAKKGAGWGIPLSILGISAWASDRAQEMSEEQQESLRNAYEGVELPPWVTNQSQLNISSGNYYKNDPRYKDWKAQQDAEKNKPLTQEQINGLAEYLKNLDGGDSSIGVFDQLPLRPDEAQEFKQMPDRIKDFSEEGRKDVKQFNEYNSEEFDTFRETGTEHFGSMHEETKRRWKSMDEITYTTMTAIRKEHEGFKSMMYFLFQPVAEYLRNLGNTSGGGITGGDLTSATIDLISGGEGGYGTVVGNDNGALSIGKFQWHGNRARDLLNAIKKRDEKTYYQHIPFMSQLNADTLNGKDWSNRTLNTWEAEKVSALLNTSIGQQIQDELASSDVESYFAKGRELGITDPQALAYFADLYNQSPAQAISIAKASNKTLAGLHAAAMENGVMSRYATRRNNAYVKAQSISGGGGNSSAGSFFKGWESRVTSHFGDKESFRRKPHGGLDIDGEQGDRLDALAGGTISFIHMDDGGEMDEDGRMNTRPGGTEVGVRMPDGRIYFYSHLSKVNPNLKVGSKVNVGDWIGDMGGEPGVAGSGTSTTGSHLHLGYMDANGNLMNPEDLLRGLDIGDSSIGTMKSAAPVQKVVSEINVNLNVSGEGAKHLNNATMHQLESLVRKIVAENERLKLQLNPTKVGYGT